MDSRNFTNDALKYLSYAYRDIGIEVDFQEYPTRRSFQKLKSQVIDGDLGRFLPVIKKHRFFYVKIPLAHLELCAFTNKDTDVPLENAVVVYERGYKVFDSMRFKNTIKLNSNKQVVNFFIKKREKVDYLLGSRPTIESILKNHKNERIVCEKSIGTIPIYHVIADKHQDLLPRLTKAIKRYFPLGQ